MTRREWLLAIGEGAVLAGFSGAEPAEPLPPGLYGPSRDHLGHALMNRDLVVPLPARFQPRFFTEEQFAVVRRTLAAILGDGVAREVIEEIARWVDLTVSEAAAVREAALKLSPAHRAVAVHYHGAGPMIELETADPQKVCRDGLAGADAQITTGTPLFEFLKTKAIEGYYTSRAGLLELDYKGNAFYAVSPGCDRVTMRQ